MLSRAPSVLGRVARVTARPALSGLSSASPARSFSYSNENKPESRETANEALSDAKSGKSAAEVQNHKATTGGKPLTREGAATGSKATKENANSSSQPVNRPDAGPDVLREEGKKSNKTDVSN